MRYSLFCDVTRNRLDFLTLEYGTDRLSRISEELIYTAVKE